MKHYLVTGGAGFIGSHIVDRLIADGHKVDVWDNLTTGYEKNLPAHKNLNFYAINALKKEHWPELPQFDAIIHCAAQTKVTKSEEDPVSDCTMNVGLTELLVSNFPDTRIVLLSTLGAMFNGDKKLPCESTPPSPISFYGINKLLSEKVLQIRHKNWAVLRLSNVYGTRQRSDAEGGVISIFLDKYKNGLEINVYGDGQQTRDFVHVNDVVSAVLLTLDKPNPINMVFHICNGRSTTVNNIIDYFKNLGMGGVTNYLPARTSEIKYSDFSLSMLSLNVLKWTPRESLYSFIEGEIKSWSKTVKSSP